MRDSAVTLEDDGPQVEPQAAKPERTRAQGAGVMRFVYATGSRPLDGFTIKRGIGVGGFGEVYFALSDAGKEVALKRIQRSMDVEVRGASQCLNLKHQNLISLFDIKYDDEGQAWVVMEYVAGESLKDVIERNPNGMPRDEVLHWFRGIAHGVSYLHNHGIIHRDLKPGNIFIDEDVVKIGDYGLSKFISCSRRSGQTESVGTFHYMAPEIGKGVYGKEIDIYALGIMLCELLSGTVPFDGESSQEIIMKHLTADPELNGISTSFRPVIERALCKDPAKRFASVDEMLANVEGAVLGVAGVPPVRRGATAEEGYFIGEDCQEDGIYLGPVREHVSAAAAGVPGTRRRPAAAPEPIAHAVGGVLTRLKHGWDHSNLSLPIKMLLLGAGIVLLVFNLEFLVPIGFVLGAMYLCYYALFRLLGPLRRPAPARRQHVSATQPASPPVPSGPLRRPAPRRYHRVKWRERARSTLSERTISERLGELSGSLLSGAIVAVVTSLFMILVGGMSLETVHTWTFFCWLALTSIAGTWLILIVSKAWEGSDGDQLRRRFVMLVAGFLLGLVAFGASEFLDVRRVSQLAVSSPPQVSSWEGMYETDRVPKLPAFLVYFAGLFAVSRWWLQSDPLRTTRLGVWATALCVVWAWIIHLILPFPQPWGLMLAATISIAVQMSSPWMASRERSRIRNQVMEA